jgi:hypothetical protein
MKTLIKQRVFIYLISTLLLATNALAQQSRIIREPAFGVEFTVPNGWQYQKNEMGYVMGHNTIAGVILVTTSEFRTMAEMKQGAYEGIQEEGGTSLQLSGQLNTFGKNGLAGAYRGTMNWEQVSAYIIGLISPFGGKAINCMIITTPSMYGDVHKTTLESLAGSFKFFKPEIPEVVKEWDTWFKTPGGCRLKYMSVSSSSYGGYTGSSSEATIDLCPNGQFTFDSNSEFSMSIDAGSAYNSSNDSGTGKWMLTYDGTNPVLELYFNDGREWEYTLTYVNQETYLNDTRYYVLFNDEGPRCY